MQCVESGPVLPYSYAVLCSRQEVMLTVEVQALYSALLYCCEVEIEGGRAALQVPLVHLQRAVQNKLPHKVCMVLT
jgi:hypothetical protein